MADWFSGKNTRMAACRSINRSIEGPDVFKDGLNKQNLIAVNSFQSHIKYRSRELKSLSTNPLVPNNDFILRLGSKRSRKIGQIEVKNW